MRQKSKRLFAQAKQYHRNHSWQLNENGIMVRHDYTHADPQAFSWWDDVGFIFGKRRIMVWWKHPRAVYQDRLQSLAYDLCEKDRPEEHCDWLADAEPIRRKVRRGLRKKVTGYRARPMSDAYQAYMEKWRNAQVQLSLVDHGWVIAPSIGFQALDWCQSVDLVLPVEVRNEADLLPLRDVVLDALRGNHAALSSFPDYGFQDWIGEQDRMRQADLHAHQVLTS